jgi:DNA-binding transcriptional ArsR family regulator
MSRRDAFIAIADPTRREILDLLRKNGPMLAGDIASEFGDASRPGISRHLRVLRECGLIASRKEGKTQVYTLNGGPLVEVRDGWLARFGHMQTASLKALRRRVEGGKS